MLTSAADASTVGSPRKEDETWQLTRFAPHESVRYFSSDLGRLLADTLRNSLAELRKDEEARMSL